MNERDWLLLKILFEEKNITKAAKRLYLSQPALTRRIQQLEREFDCQIVIRCTRGIEFCTEGELVVGHAIRCLNDLRQTKELVGNIGGKICGTLRIACSNVFAKYELPDVLREFRNQYSDVEINVKTGFSQSVHQLVLNGNVHLGIIRGNYQWFDQKYLLCEEPYYIVSAEPIDMEKLPTLPKIHYKTDSQLQADMDSWWFMHYSQEPIIAMEVDTIDTCVQLISKGLGYAVLSGMSLKNIITLHKEKLLFKDGSALQRKTWLCYRENTLSVVTAKAFVNFLKIRYSH